MPEGAAELVQLRNKFYYDSYKSLWLALLLMVIVNLLLVGVIYYQVTHKPLPQYFAISSDGKIVKLQPLSEPVVSSAILLQWAGQASVSTYSYNFVNYREALQQVQNKFTADGWRNFENALRSSRMLETVVSKKLVVSAVATGAPVILDQGVIGGYYAWKVNIPILVTYESATESTPVPLDVTMVISRVSTINHPDGIAISSFVAAEGRIKR